MAALGIVPAVVLVIVILATISSTTAANGTVILAFYIRSVILERIEVSPWRIDNSVLKLTTSFCFQIAERFQRLMRVSLACFYAEKIVEVVVGMIPFRRRKRLENRRRGNITYSGRSLRITVFCCYDAVLKKRPKFVLSHNIEKRITR